MVCDDQCCTPLACCARGHLSCLKELVSGESGSMRGGGGVMTDEQLRQLWPEAFVDADEVADVDWDEPDEIADSSSAAAAAPSPLHIACYQLNEPIVRFLVEDMPSARSRRLLEAQSGAAKLTPACAAVDGAARALKAADEAGVAAARAVFALLASRGARFDARNALDGSTVVHRASHSNCVHLLLEPVLQSAPDSVSALVRLSDGKKQRLPLHEAVRGGGPDAIRFLIDQAGAPLDAVDSRLNSCLHYAANYNAPKSCVFLVERFRAAGLPLDRPARDGRSPLLHAAARGNLRWVRALASGDDGALLDQTDETDGRSALHLAARKGALDLVKWLCSKRPELRRKPDDFGRQPLHVAAQRNQADTVAYLLKHAGVPLDPVDKHGYTPLCLAAEANARLALSALLKRGASVNVAVRSGSQPLHLAAEHGWHKVVKKLLAADGVDAEAREQAGQTALHLACSAGFDQVARVLMSACSVLSEAADTSGLTPLHCACNRGHSAVARLLLDKSPALYARVDGTGLSPLMAASFQGHAQTVLLLLERGAPADARDHQGMTALHYAAGAGHFAVLQALMQHSGLPVDQLAMVPNSQGRGPIHLAAMAGQYDALAFLIERYPEERHINWQDEDGGNTALHLTARHNRPQCAQLLLDAGARLGVRNDDQLTAAQLSEDPRQSSTETARLIRSYMPSGEEEEAGSDRMPTAPDDNDDGNDTDNHREVAPDELADDSSPLAPLPVMLSPRRVSAMSEPAGNRRLSMAPTHGLQTAPPEASSAEVAEAEARGLDAVMAAIVSGTSSGQYERPSDQTLSAIRYVLRGLLAVDSPLLASLLATCQPSDADKCGKALVLVFRGARAAVRMLCTAVDGEVGNTQSAGTLFRANSLASKMLTQFALACGRSYLESTVLPSVRSVLSHDRAYEVDPSRVTPGAGDGPDGTVADNQDTLLALTTSFLDAVCNSANACPASLRALCQHLQSATLSRFPDADPSFAVGGFFFLRFVTPAVVTPDGGAKLLEAGAVNRECRRTLTLLSKIVTCAANGVKFGDKEQFMVFANRFLDAQAATVRQFLGTLASAAGSHVDGVQTLLTDADAPEPEPGDVVAAFNALYKHLSYNQPKILQHLEEQGGDGQALAQVLRETFVALGTQHPVLAEVSQANGGGGSANAGAVAVDKPKLAREDSSRTVKSKMSKAWGTIRRFGKS